MAESAVSGVLNFCTKSPEEEYSRLQTESPYTPLGASRHYPNSIDKITTRDGENMDTDRANEKIQADHPFNHNIQTSAFRRVSPKQKGLIYNISQYTKLYYFNRNFEIIKVLLTTINFKYRLRRQEARCKKYFFDMGN